MIDFLAHTLQTLLKYGFSLTGVAIIVVGLFRLKAFRKWINPYMPPLLRDSQDSEVKAYVANQRFIMHQLYAMQRNQRVIMRTIGVGEQWRGVRRPSSKKDRTSSKVLSNIFYKATLRVDRSRRTMKMKWFKPDKIAISMGVIIAAANEYFGWALDTENVAAFFFMLFVFFKQHEIVTITRHAHGLPSQIKVNSTKLVYTLIGLALTAADTFYNIGLGTETVLLIAASISGYNAYEGKADLVKTEPEAKIAEVERLRVEMEAAAASEPKHPLDAH